MWGVWKPHHSCSTWPGESCLPFLCNSCVLVAGWLVAGDICLSVCCSCAYAWGGHQGPPPHVILALSMQGPQCLHFVCVPCGFVCCMCVFFGAVACVSLWLCWSLLSLLYLCVGICLSIPLLVLCPQLSPREREDSDAAPPINSCLTAFLCSVTPQKWTPE